MSSPDLNTPMSSPNPAIVVSNAKETRNIGKDVTPSVTSSQLSHSSNEASVLRKASQAGKEAKRLSSASQSALEAKRLSNATQATLEAKWLSNASQSALEAESTSNASQSAIDSKTLHSASKSANNLSLLAAVSQDDGQNGELAPVRDNRSTPSTQPPPVPMRNMRRLSKSTPRLDRYSTGSMPQPVQLIPAASSNATSSTKRRNIQGFARSISTNSATRTKTVLTTLGKKGLSRKSKKQPVFYIDDSNISERKSKNVDERAKSAGAARRHKSDAVMRNRRRRRSRVSALHTQEDSEDEGSFDSLTDSQESSSKPTYPIPPASHTHIREGNSSWQVIEDTLNEGESLEDKPKKCDGYMLKRRKWPMKGWHKRYFVLENGILTYAKSPGDIQRAKTHGQVDIGFSVLACKRTSRRVDIDAEDVIYHLKVKQAHKYDEWLRLLKLHRLYRQQEITQGTQDNPKLTDVTTPLVEERTPITSPVSPVPFDRAYGGSMKSRNLQFERSQSKVTAWLLDASGIERCNKELSAAQGAIFELSTILEKFQSLSMLSSVVSTTESALDQQQQEELQQIDEQSSIKGYVINPNSNHVMSSAHHVGGANNHVSNNHHHNHVASSAPVQPAAYQHPLQPHLTNHHQSSSSSNSGGSYHPHHQRNNSTPPQLSAAAQQQAVQQYHAAAAAATVQQQQLHSSNSTELHDPNLSKKEKKQRKSALKKAVRKERKTQSQDSKDSLSMSGGLVVPSSPLHLSSSNPNLASRDADNARPTSLPDSYIYQADSRLQEVQLRQDFVNIAKTVHSTLRSLSRNIGSERERLKHAIEHEKGASLASSSTYIMSLRQALHEALKQNSDFRSRLARIHGDSNLSEVATSPTADDHPLLQTQAPSWESASVNEFYDAEEYLISSEETSEISDDEDEGASDISDTENTAAQSEDDVMGSLAMTGRRSQLPTPRPNTSDLSLWNLLSRNIGKDLSKISMPVALNEPLSMLQRLCEELEYSDLLDRAAETADAAERMVLIAAFSVSPYAATYYRAGQKPFNPLLGETYECIREDKGWRFIAEQVSHHPPISACHCDSKNFVFWQDTRIKTKFWGKSMEFQPIGCVNLAIPKYKDHFTWNKVTTCVHNILGGQRWVDHYGEVVIRNETNGMKCKLTFAKSGYWSNKRHEVYGTVISPEGKTLHQLFGKWNEGIYCGHAPSAKCIWRPSIMPEDHEMYYGFTRFAVELNEIDQEQAQLYAPTDSRFRPDQRALEEGHLQEAENEKLKLEQNQRERRKQREEERVSYSSRWFMKMEDDKKEQYKFTGKYWEMRKDPGFIKMSIPKLF